MFERFTDRTRRTVVLAQEDARLLRHNYIGTEHVLLGLVHEGEGIAAQVLAGFGYSLDFVRDQVRDIVGEGSSSPTGHIPFTPRAKKVLDMSLRESLALGVNYIGTEHVLLGMLREGEGVAAQILVRKAELGVIRDELLRVVLSYLPAAPPVEAEAVAPDYMDAISVCQSALDLLESDQHRRAALAYLGSWYSK